MAKKRRLVACGFAIKFTDFAFAECFDELFASFKATGYDAPDDKRPDVAIG